MTDIAGPRSAKGNASLHEDGRPKLHHPVSPLAVIIFLLAVGATLLFVTYSLYVDVGESKPAVTTFSSRRTLGLSDGNELEPLKAHGLLQAT